MKVIGRMISATAREKRCLKMVHSTTVCLRTALKRDMELINGLKVRNTLETGRTINFTATENTSGQTAEHILEAGLKINCMVMVSTAGPTADSILVNI